jgi:hypothetical protein
MNFKKEIIKMTQTEKTEVNMGQPSKPATRVMKSRFSHKKNRKDTNEKKMRTRIKREKKHCTKPE